MKKRIITLIAATSVIMGLMSGCGKSGSSEPKNQLEAIKKAGEIKIAMEGTWAPWTYHDKNDKLVGYDVDVAKAVAKKLGVKAKFMEGEWDGLFAGLDSGRYDVVVNGVDVTPERSKKYDFTEPYAYIRTVIMVSSDNNDLTSFKDLKGKTTANTISSVYAEDAEKNGAKVTGVDDLNQTIELLLQKRIDATLNSEVTYLDYTREHPDAKVKIAAYSDDANSIAIPVKKGETELRDAISDAIKELKDDGTLAKLSKKYFGADLTKHNK